MSAYGIYVTYLTKDLNLHLIRIPETGSLLSISIHFPIYPLYIRFPPSCIFFFPVQFNLSCIPNTLNISNEGSRLPVAFSQILTVENLSPCPKFCDVYFINKLKYLLNLLKVTLSYFNQSALTRILEHAISYQSTGYIVFLYYYFERGRIKVEESSVTFWYRLCRLQTQLTRYCSVLQQVLPK